MVYDKEDLERQPRLSFTHGELEAITEAAKADDDIRARTIEKLKILTAYSRTKAAYNKGPTTITAK